MGEAKRRKQRDLSYAKVPSLKTSGYKEKHFEQIIDDLHSQCESELKTLIFAEKIPDNYQEIRAQLASWVGNKVSKYQKEDQEMIVTAMLLFFSEMYKEYDVSSMIIICFLEILKSYLSLELYEKIADSIENILAEFKVELELTSTT